MKKDEGQQRPSLYKHALVRNTPPSALHSNGSTAPFAKFVRIRCLGSFLEKWGGSGKKRDFVNSLQKFDMQQAAGASCCFLFIEAVRQRPVQTAQRSTTF